MKITATVSLHSGTAGIPRRLIRLPSLVALFCLLACTGITLPAQAQMIDRMGIQASGNLSKVVTSHYENRMSRRANIGYGLGIFTETDFSETVSLIVSAEFTSRRYEYSVNSAEGQQGTHNLFFISAPLMLKVKGAGNLSPYYAKFGPRFDFYLATRHEWIMDCSSWECGHFGDTEVLGDTRTMVPGWSGALGADLSVLDTPFSMELRFNDDLSGMSSTPREHPAQKISFDLWISIPLTSEKPERSGSDEKCRCIP